MFEFNGDRDAYVMEQSDGDKRFRIVIGRDFVDEELGSDAGQDERLEWLRQNLPGVLAACTARINGGWVKAPWDRILVEEVN